MNKLSIVLCFFLIATVSAGGFNDFLTKLNNGLAKVNEKTTEVANTVNQVAGATEKTLKLASNMVESITKDLKTVSEDVKALGATFEKEFGALYNDALKIIDKTKTFISAGYKDGQALYKDVNKQLTALIASAQADLDRAVSTAKITIAQLSSDVRIVYSNGKIVAQQVQEAADLNAAIAQVKAKNKEALDKTIATINKAIADANAIIANANAALKQYKSTADKYTSDVKTGAKQIIVNMETFVAAATKQLEEFKKAQEKTLKQIISDAEALYKSSKTVLEQANATIDKAVDLFNKNKEVVEKGKTEIEQTWSKDGLKAQTGATTTDLKKITDAVTQATTSVKTITDEGQKVTTVLTSTEVALTGVNQQISAELKNIVFKVTADTLNVRAGPGTTHKVVKTLTKGTQVSVSAQSGTWSKIGENEWVATQYLTIADKDAAKASANKISTAIESTLTSLKSLFGAIGK